MWLSEYYLFAPYDNSKLVLPNPRKTSRSILYSGFTESDKLHHVTIQLTNIYEEIRRGNYIKIKCLDLRLSTDFL